MIICMNPRTPVAGAAGPHRVVGRSVMFVMMIIIQTVFLPLTKNNASGPLLLTVYCPYRLEIAALSNRLALSRTCKTPCPPRILSHFQTSPESNLLDRRSLIVWRAQFYLIASPQAVTINIPARCKTRGHSRIKAVVRDWGTLGQFSRWFPQWCCIFDVLLRFHNFIFQTHIHTHP